MNDLLQRLSASGEKIGVTCEFKKLEPPLGFDCTIQWCGRQVEFDEFSDDIQLGDATMLLLKALEAKGYAPVLDCVRDAETGETLGYEVDLQGRALDHPDGPCHAWCWETPPAPTYFEAVLKATVEVVEGLS